MNARTQQNWGPIISVGLFLLIQTTGGVWWAASVNTNVNSMGAFIKQREVDGKEENLRQWARINALEEATQIALSNDNTWAASISSVKDTMQDLRIDVRQINALLREILQKGPTSGK